MLNLGYGWEKFGGVAAMRTTESRTIGTDLAQCPLSSPTHGS